MTTRVRLVLLACTALLGARARGQRARGVHTGARDRASAADAGDDRDDVDSTDRSPRRRRARARRDLRRAGLLADHRPGGRDVAGHGDRQILVREPIAGAVLPLTGDARGADRRRSCADEHDVDRDDGRAVHRHADARGDLARDAPGVRPEPRRADRRSTRRPRRSRAGVVRARRLPAESEHPARHAGRGAVRREARARAADFRGGFTAADEPRRRTAGTSSPRRGRRRRTRRTRRHRRGAGAASCSRRAR